MFLHERFVSKVRENGVISQAQCNIYTIVHGLKAKEQFHN